MPKFPREATFEARENDARMGSAELLERLEYAFLRFSREHRVDYLDARTLLMNATGL